MIDTQSGMLLCSLVKREEATAKVSERKTTEVTRFLGSWRTACMD